MKLALLIVGALLAVSISARPAGNKNLETVDQIENPEVVEEPKDEDKLNTEEKPKKVSEESPENPEKIPKNENSQEKPSNSKAKKPYKAGKFQDEISAFLDFDVDVDEELQAKFLQLLLDPNQTAQQKLDAFVKESGDKKYDEEEKDILSMFFHVFDQLKEAWVNNISKGLNQQATDFFDKVWEGMQESAKTGNPNPTEAFMKDMQQMGDELTQESVDQIMTAFGATIEVAKKALADGQNQLFEKYGDKEEAD